MQNHRSLSLASQIIVIALMFLIVSTTQAQEAAECEAGQRLFEHAMGETCVPENPERVVVLEWSYTEDVLALGVQPVGMADIAGYSNWVKIPLALDEDVIDVGTRQEPNLEVIAGLNPDLIIGVYFRVTQNYDDLSAIAPTLVFNPYPDELTSQYEEMTSTFLMIASALNREDEGQQVLEDMEDYFASAAAALEAEGRDGETFILSQTFMSSDVPTFRLFTDNAMAVQILEQIGLSNAWDDAPQLYGYSQVDMEAFAAVGDTNFFYVAQADHNDYLAGSPLWSGLPFVQSGRDYWLGGDVWFFGGPLSAEVMVEGVLQAMGIELPVIEATPEATDVP